MWLARNTRGIPDARPYCPATFVGTWIARRGARWRFDEGGTLTVTRIVTVGEHPRYELSRLAVPPARG